MFQDSGGGFVDQRVNVQVVKVNFTGTAATANAHITWLGSAPGEGGNISPAGVVRIFRFARNTLDLQKHINSHNIYSSWMNNIAFEKALIWQTGKHGAE